MYRIIDRNIDVLLKNINFGKHIAPYQQICTDFTCRQSETLSFKTIFKNFYQLKAARLSQDFCEKYFLLLESCRDHGDIRGESIVRSLLAIPSNSSGKCAVHFSFSTKLAHTLNNDLPIYDSKVSDFYFLPKINLSWDAERKIEEYMLQYRFLVDEYKRIIDDGLMSLSISLFRREFDQGALLTDAKVIDTLIWRCASFLRSGAIRNGDIKYCN